VATACQDAAKAQRRGFRRKALLEDRAANHCKIYRHSAILLPFPKKKVLRKGQAPGGITAAPHGQINGFSISGARQAGRNWQPTGQSEGQRPEQFRGRWQSHRPAVREDGFPVCKRKARHKHLGTGDDP
jgi:hypothetical protein